MRVAVLDQFYSKKKLVRLGWTVLKCPESQTFWKSWQAVSKRILEFPDGLNFTDQFPCFHMLKTFRIVSLNNKLFIYDKNLKKEKDKDVQGLF